MLSMSKLLAFCRSLGLTASIIVSYDLFMLHDLAKIAIYKLTRHIAFFNHFLKFSFTSLSILFQLI